MSGKPPPSRQYVAKNREVPLKAVPILEAADAAIAKGKYKKANRLLEESDRILTEEAKKGIKLSGMNKPGAVGPIKSYISPPNYEYGGSKKTRRRRRGGGSENVWGVVQQVCLALGLRTCPLNTPSAAEKTTVEEINPPRFDEWGPPPESPEEEAQSFLHPDPGKPPLCPKVPRRLPESENIKKEALYLRDVARDLNARGNRELAEKFMKLAKAAYARSCAAKATEEKTTPLEKIGIAEKGQVGAPRKGGKTQRIRRNKSHR